MSHQMPILLRSKTLAKEVAHMRETYEQDKCCID